MLAIIAAAMTCPFEAISSAVQPAKTGVAAAIVKAAQSAECVDPALGHPEVGAVSAASGRSLLGRTRQRVAANKRHRPTSDENKCVSHGKCRAHFPGQPNTVQMLAARETNGRNYRQKLSRVKSLCDMRLHVRGRGVALTMLRLHEHTTMQVFWPRTGL